MRHLPGLLRHLRSCIQHQTRDKIAATILCSVCLFGSDQKTSAEEDAPQAATANASVEPETVRLTIHPKGEGKPSLKIQLVPDPSQQLDGNAAVFYLKAMGFLEQDPARDHLREMQKKAAEQANANGKTISDFPPYSYLEMRPKDYPKAEVREYLDSYLRFQVPSLREARRMSDFSMHRNIHLSDNPIGYLIPEMQSMRDLARNQSIRCRLAIAEDRIDDAIEVIGQQVTMSRHIGKDDFLISSLVGNAVLGIAIQDTLYLLEHAQCPNLYWAFAQLPNPLVETERCLALERQFMYLQIPKLKEIDTTPRSPASWKEFIADFAKRTSDLDEYNEGSDAIISKTQGENRAEAIQESIADNTPQAKDYLLSRAILPNDTIESYPNEQLIFLAMKDYYEFHRDEQFKWFNFPYSVAHNRIAIANERMQEDRKQFGWFTRLPEGLLQNMGVFYTAVTRTRQRIAVIQAIEAIRMAGAENGGKLIDSLDKAPVPVPNDPFTDKPFSYQVSGNVAILSSEFPTNAPVRIELQFAN